MGGGRRREDDWKSPNRIGRQMRRDERGQKKFRIHNVTVEFSGEILIGP